MTKLTAAVLLLFLSLTAWAQPRTSAGYDCEEELFPRYDKATRTYGYVNIVGVWRVEPTFTKAERFSGRLAVVQRGTKFGLINCQGNLAANTVFDEIQNFVNGRGWVRQGALWGLLDEKGKLIVPPAFEEIKPVTPRSELTWVKKKGVWGVFSKERIKMVIEPSYEACRSISDSLGLGLKGGYVAPIYLGTGQVIYDSCTVFTKASGNSYLFTYRKKDGLMEASGTVLMRPEYDTLAVYFHYLLAKKDAKWAIATLYGKLETGLEYNEMLGSEGTLVAVRKGNKWGYLLPNGKTYLPLEYEDALPQHGRYYALQRGKGLNSWAINSIADPLTDADFAYQSINYTAGPNVAILGLDDSLSTMMSTKTGALYSGAFATWGWSDSTRYIDVSRGGFTANGMQGLVDTRNFSRNIPMRKGIKPSYLRNGYVALSEATGRGLYSLDAKRYIIPTEYDFIGALEGSALYQAYKQEKITVFNAQGKPVFTVDGQSIAYYKPNHYLIQQKEKWGLVQASDKFILKPQFDKLTVSGTAAEQGGLPLIGMRKGKVQLFGADGKELGESYASIRYINEAYYAAQKGDVFVLLDRQGKEAAPTQYGQVSDFSDGLLLVQQNGKQMFLNRSLKPAFNLALEDAESYQNGTARVKLAGRYVRINKAGKTIQALE